MVYTITLEQFSGPFHLLLNLIEENKLDITNISLAAVSDDFLAYLEKNKEIDPNELADFLLVAAKLLLIKSSLLLPEPIQLDDEALNLENQIKIYREYHQASKLINKIFNRNNIALARTRPHYSIQIGPLLEISIKPKILAENFERTMKLFLEIQQLPQKTIKKFISLQEMIKKILGLVKKGQEASFEGLIKGFSRTEVVMSFLAILEMSKRRLIFVKQAGPFEKIIIEKV